MIRRFSAFFSSAALVKLKEHRSNPKEKTSSATRLASVGFCFEALPWTQRFLTREVLRRAKFRADRNKEDRKGIHNLWSVIMPHAIESGGIGARRSALFGLPIQI